MRGFYPKIAAIVVLSCVSIVFHGQADETSLSIANERRFESTDRIVESIARDILDLETVAVIDHARLAAREGVPMPAATVTIFSDPAINSALLSRNIRVGLDLPQKILVYHTDDGPRVLSPASSFLAARHDITVDKAARAYDAAIEKGLRHVDGKVCSQLGGDNIKKNYGILELDSVHSFGETIQKLKKAMLSQGDTVWFGEIDFQREAAGQKVSLPPATLLLFGGPKPGGIAMAKFPKLGLDAFCQKLLVYMDDDGNVKVIFNDIAEFAKLHYGMSAKPHEVINGRLKKTFESAVEAD